MSVKAKIKGIISNRIKPVCSYSIINQKIVINIKENQQLQYSFKILNKNYKVKKGNVEIPYDNNVLNAIQKKKYSVLVSGYSKTLEFRGKELNMSLEKELYFIENTTYSLKEDGYVYVKIDEKDGQIRINSKFVEIGKHEEDGLCFVLNSEFKIIQKYTVSQVTDIELNLGKLREVDAYQILYVKDHYAYPIVSNGWEGDCDKLTCVTSRLYVQEMKEESYITEKLSHKIPGIIPKYKYIKEIDFNEQSQTFHIKEKENVPSDGQIKVYLVNLNTNQRIEIYNGKTKKEHVIEQLDDISNRKITLVERYLFEFEISNQNKKVLEKAIFKIARKKIRKPEESILFQSHGNQISVLNYQIPVLENRENHFTYSEKFDFSLNENTFCTDVDLYDGTDGTVQMHIKLNAILSPIRQYSVFLVDNYLKNSYELFTSKISEPNQKIEETVPINMDIIKKHRYYNVRFNVRIGVEYVGGYREYGFLEKRRGDYSTRERYLYRYINNEEMNTMFYIGENLYNLNIWYSSKEEIKKGIDFQEGREEYKKMLQTEAIDNDLIVFEANLGKNYTGNPKYLYEYMIQQPEYSNFKYVWAYPDVDADTIPGNPILEKRGSKEYFHYLGKAKYWVNNIIFPVKEKRDDTVYLQTWHGTPLKKLGFDIECEGPEKQAFGNLYKESQNWDYFLADNDYGEEKLVNAFRFKKKVIKEGYPINDIFYDKERIQRVSSRLEKTYQQIADKKVILYAPTWRDLQGDYVRGYEFELPFDVEALYKKLSKEYVLVVKLHHLIADNLVIDEKHKEFLINASQEEDIMELLCVTDILVTDYSSVFYDFASARKPMLFYMYDLEEYLNETRGLYVDISELPGPILRNSEELERAVMDINQYEYEAYDKLHHFCDEMAKYCHGDSCKKVLDIVIKEKK
ncbi:MAG: CDP-glycerol glycerophosphotransferase family protein [Anaerostipes sp.]|nr:CDP-glycerol glycerophosphotransferase family protein [Anaerostipes sp.]MDD3747388.1 CDP-glycerol glycerophosphotransferase family protein [Anaerostipes sp.]